MAEVSSRRTERQTLAGAVVDRLYNRRPPPRGNAAVLRRRNPRRFGKIRQHQRRDRHVGQTHANADRDGYPYANRDAHSDAVANARGAHGDAEVQSARKLRAGGTRHLSDSGRLGVGRRRADVQMAKVSSRRTERQTLAGSAVDRLHNRRQAPQGNAELLRRRDPRRFGKVRQYQRRDSHVGQTHAHANGCARADADRDGYAHADGYADAGRSRVHGYANAYDYAHAGRSRVHGYANADDYANGHSNADDYANSYANADDYANADRNGYPYADSHARPQLQCIR